MPVIIKNLTIILLAAITLLTFLLIFSYLIKITLIGIQKVTKLITYKVILKSKWVYLLAFYEICLLIVPGILLILFHMNMPPIFGLLTYISIIIIALIVMYIKKEHTDMFSLLDHILDKINTKNYLVNRLGYLFKQTYSIIVLFLISYITFFIFTQLEWIPAIYYIGFISFPIYLNIWIYVSYKLKLENKDTISVRRFIVYSLLVIYIMGDCYSKFYSLLFYNTAPKVDIISLFFYMLASIFIAIERLIKVVINDYAHFKTSMLGNNRMQ